MIGVDDLLKIIKIVIYSGRLVGETPLSLLIIASVGAGKTSMLRKLFDLDGILYATEITPYALTSKHGNKLKAGKIRHIVAPDLLNPLNKPRDQANAFITFMNALIEDGVAKVQSRHSNFTVEFPVKVGFISSIAYQDFKKREDAWATVGFLSRMLPVSYNYADKTVREIFDSIFTCEYREDSEFKLDLPPLTKVNIGVKLAEQLEPIAKTIKDPQDQYGFRRQHQLQTFAMAHALGRNRDKVKQEDIDAIKYYAQYMNYECKQQL